MKTVYFPYTTIASWQAQRLAAIWGPVTLLQPSPGSCLPETKALQQEGLIETLLPPAAGHGSLQDALNEFRQWAARHSGGDLAAMMEQGQAIPFFSSQSSAQIVAEIRKGGGQTARTTGGRPDQKLFQAQLLLAMAQERDLQERELARDIAALAVKEKEMMALLKGEAGGEPGEGASDGLRISGGFDPMLTMRLRAWARVILSLPEKDWGSAESERLFLTDNRSALEHIQEIFPEAQTRLWGYRWMAGGLPPMDVGAMPGWLMDPLQAEPQREVARGTVAVFDLIEIPCVSAGVFPQVLAERVERKNVASPVPEDGASCWVGCMAMAEDARDNPFDTDGI